MVGNQEEKAELGRQGQGVHCSQVDEQSTILAAGQTTLRYVVQFQC